MSGLPFINRISPKKQGTLTLISRIKDGDSSLRDKFIREHSPFIIKSVSKVLGKYIEVENSEEFSIGLIAFNSAIDKFDTEKGDNFWNYSERIIRSRIVDYLRSSKKEKMVLPFTYFENNENFMETQLFTSSEHTFHDIDIEEELNKFKEDLKLFGISLNNIVALTPKHHDSIAMFIKVSKIISDDEFLYEELLRKKRIPMRLLVDKVNIHPRTIEKNRKFIIAVCLIFKSDLDIMKCFLKWTMKGGKSLG